MCPSYCIEKDFTISLKWTSFRSLQIILYRRTEDSWQIHSNGIFSFQLRINFSLRNTRNSSSIIFNNISCPFINIINIKVIYICCWWRWRDAKRKLFFSRMFRNRIRISGHIFLTKTSAMALSHLFHCHLSLASSIKRSSDTKKDTASSYLLTMEFLQFTSFSGVRHFYLKLVVIVN